MKDVEDFKKPGIYQITNKVNGKIYIGSSFNVKTRLLHHLQALKNNRHCNKHLQNAFNKYSLNNFEFKLLSECENDKDKLLEKEQFYLDIYKPEYNICKVAGSNKGVKFTQEHIDKIVNKNKGLKRSVELKEKLSKIQKSIIRPEYYKNLVEKARECNFKKVKMYDLKNNFIKEFNSLTAASIEIKGNVSAISKVCKGKLKKHKNFIFRF